MTLLIQWQQLENYLDEGDEAIDLINNNQYAYVHEHLGGNLYIAADNSEKIDWRVNLRYYGSVEQK